MPGLSAPDGAAPLTPRSPVRQQLDESLGTIHQLLDQLAREAQLPAGLHLSPREVARLEAALGVAVPFHSPETLVAAVERLASIGFGDIRVPFTPGQLQEIAHRASKRGRTVEAEMQAVVARIRDELFYRAG